MTFEVFKFGDLSKLLAVLRSEVDYGESCNAQIARCFAAFQGAKRKYSKLRKRRGVRLGAHFGRFHSRVFATLAHTSHFVLTS